MNFLLVSRTEAGTLLRFYNWSVSKVHDEWFADEERVRRSVGLVLHRNGEESRPLPEELTCGICFELHSLKNMKATVGCGHFFCDSCWTAYIHTAISDGTGCLTLHCADPSCGAAVGEDMVLSLVSREDGVKYTRYLLRSFVENNKTVKSCPAPGCENAVEKCVPRVGSFDIVCKCSHNFCWNCLEDAHRPVDCDTVAKWNLLMDSGGPKNSAEVERYKYFYERWVTNESSREKALTDLQLMLTVEIYKLSDKQCQPFSQLKFVNEAWEQIVECRRALKWTDVYAYYLRDDEPAKGEFLEYVQGEAAHHVEGLNQCADNDLRAFLDPGDNPKTRQTFWPDECDTSLL